MWSNRRRRDDFSREHRRTSDSTWDHNDADVYRASLHDDTLFLPGNTERLDERHIYRDDRNNVYSNDFRKDDNERGYGRDRDKMYEDSWQDSSSGHFRDRHEIEFYQPYDEKLNRDAFPYGLEDQKMDRVGDRYEMDYDRRQNDTGYNNRGRSWEPRLDDRGSRDSYRNSVVGRSHGSGDERRSREDSKSKTFKADYRKDTNKGNNSERSSSSRSNIKSENRITKSSDRISNKITSNQKHLNKDNRPSNNSYQDKRDEKLLRSEQICSKGSDQRSRTKSDDRRGSRDRNSKSDAKHFADKATNANTARRHSPSNRQKSQERKREENSYKNNDRNKNDDKFKRPKEIHRSRKDSGINESDHFVTSYHEDDILSIMAEDEGFDRDTKRVLGPDSIPAVVRKRSHEREIRQNDSQGIEMHGKSPSSGVRDSRLDRQQRENRKSAVASGKRHGEGQSDSRTAPGRIERREMQKLDSNYKSNFRNDRRTQVFASKLKKRTLQGYRKNEISSYNRAKTNAGRGRFSLRKGNNRPRERYPAGKYGPFGNNNVRKDRPFESKSFTKDEKNQRVSKEHRSGIKVSKIRDSSMWQGHDKDNGLNRSKSGAVLFDDRSDRVKRFNSIDKKRFPLRSDNRTYNKGSFRGKGGGFVKPFSKTGKSIAFLKQENIKKRYQTVRHRMINRRQNEREAERQIERNMTLEDDIDRENANDIRIEMTDDQLKEEPQQVYFIPHTDMAHSQPHFIDQMGNILINPSVGIPQGDGLQFIPQGLPAQDTNSGEQQQLIFIPFSHMPNMPENMMSPKEVSNLEEEEDISQKKAELIDKSSKTVQAKKPLSNVARRNIRNRLQRKRRLALEKKIEQKILDKLMKNPNLASGNATGPKALKRKPLIKRISPPRETSHVNKKVKLVRKTTPRQEELDDVSEEYDNVSEFEDVSDMEDVSEEEEDDEQHLAERHGVRHQAKRPVFRKPGQSRIPRQQTNKDGDVRRVVSQSSGGRGGSSVRRTVMEVGKRQLVKSEKEKKPTFIKKRRSMSPIEITVSNDYSHSVLKSGNNRTQTGHSYGSTRQQTRLRPDEDDGQTIKKTEAHSRSSSAGRYDRNDEYRATGRSRLDERIEETGKYKKESFRQYREQRSDHSRGGRQNYGTSPEGNRNTAGGHRRMLQSPGTDRNDGRKGRSRSDSEDYSRQHSGIYRRKEYDNDFNNQEQYEIHSSRATKHHYSPFSSQSYSVQPRPPVVVYSSSDTDYSLPPQQYSQMSAPIAPPLIQNTPDMSMPPPLGSGTHTSMSQVVVQHQPIQNFSQSNFSQQQQQYQAQFQQQPVAQQQNNSQTVRIVHQPVGTSQQQSLGGQHLQNTGMEMGYIQQNMSHSQMQGSQIGGPMMGQIQQNIQSQPQQPYLTHTGNQTNSGNFGTVYQRNVSSQHVVEAPNPASNSPYLANSGSTNKGRGKAVGVLRSAGNGRFTGKPSHAHVIAAAGQSYHDRGRDHNDDFEEEEPMELLCSKCDKVSLSDEAMRNHTKWHDKADTGDKQWRCDLCEQAFSNSKQNEIHNKEKHRVDAWNCNLCDQTFRSASALEQHLQHINHQSTKLLYNCSVCPANFLALKFLIQHKRDHHSDTGMGGNYRKH